MGQNLPPKLVVEDQRTEEPQVDPDTSEQHKNGKRWPQMMEQRETKRRRDDKDDDGDDDVEIGKVEVTVEVQVR